jgi:hypothetical protein
VGEPCGVFFDYPFHPDHRVPSERIGAELFARAGALYFGEPERMRQSLPLTHGASSDAARPRLLESRLSCTSEKVCICASAVP